MSTISLVAYLRLMHNALEERDVDTAKKLLRQVMKIVGVSPSK